MRASDIVAKMEQNICDRNMQIERLEAKVRELQTNYDSARKCLVRAEEENSTLRAQLAGKWVLGEPLNSQAFDALDENTPLIVERFDGTLWQTVKSRFDWDEEDDYFRCLFVDPRPWPTLPQPEVPAVPKRIAYGDEWAKYEYRGYVIFDTCCGQAGCYVGHSYYGRTLQEACSKIDKLLAALNESEATE